MTTETLITPDMLAEIELVDKKELDHPDPRELLVHRQKAGPRLAKKPLAYGADCDQHFHAFHSSGLRPLDVINLHIIHCTQSDVARGTASYFTTSTAGGSAQYVVDDYECYRCLRDNQIAWGAPGANYHGLHYEMCGYVTWRQAIWSSTHRRTMMRCAWKVARDCHKYGNPVKWLGVDELRLGRKGISDHATCTKAFGGTHTDPGPNFPRPLFMGMVRTFYVGMKVARIA